MIANNFFVDKALKKRFWFFQNSKDIRPPPPKIVFLPIFVEIRPVTLDFVKILLPAAFDEILLPLELTLT